MTISSDQFLAQLKRVAERMVSLRERLNELDAQMGDGDTGISVSKAGVALQEYLSANPSTIDASIIDADLGKYLAAAGMAVNRAASSTMGTLLATGLMRMGKEAKGASDLSPALLAQMVSAIDQGIQERGKAKLGDKTIVDALHPAAVAFAQAIEAGEPLASAGQKALAAAQAGRDAATALRSNIGRASWVGERTAGALDPGTVLCVELIAALLE